LLLAYPLTGNAVAVSSQPLPVMQMNPGMTRFLDPQAENAWILSKGDLFLDMNHHYASIFLADALPAPQRYLADMELYVADLRLNYGLGAKMDITFRQTLLRPTAGVLDPFLRNYHKAFGLPNSGREFRPDNQFGYFYRGSSGGWTGRARWELGNTELYLRRQIYADRNQAMTMLAALQMPGASRSRGWSNGSPDAGLGLAVSGQTGSLFGHLEGWGIHPFGQIDLGAPTQNYFRVTALAGYRASIFSHPLNLIVQVQGGGSPYQTGIAALDTRPWLISFGFRAMSREGLQWSFAFTENISQKSTQDFSLMLGVRIPVTYLRNQ